MDFVTAFLIFVFVLLIISFLCYSRYRQMNLLRDNNIPGPKPNFIWGNMKEYNSTPNVIWDSQLIAKYGPICGYYIGAKPVIVTSNPDLIKEIQVENCRNFQERPRRVPGGINPDPLRAKMLGNLPVPEWKCLRKILSHSFRPCVLKSMVPVINGPITDMMNELFMKTQQNTQSAELNIYPLFQNLTFELISQTGFGVHSNFNDDCQLREDVELEFSKSATSILTKLCLCFPQITILQRIRIYFHKGSTGPALRNLCAEALKKRIVAVDVERDDILQVMLNTIKDDDLKIIANSILFYEAAYETLSAGLAFTMHILINNEGVQQKVREEILDFLKRTDGQISAESIKDLKYLDAVIKEALRMYPPQTTFISRSGKEEFVYKKYDKTICTIPKGVQIQISLVHQPFGNGPRRCIGLSYAKLVLPLVLATILSSYTLPPSPRTEKKIKLLYKTATITPRNGCFGIFKFEPIMP